MSNFVKFVRQKIADNLLQLPNFVRTGTSLTWSGPPFLSEPDLGFEPKSAKFCPNQDLASKGIIRGPGSLPEIRPREWGSVNGRPVSEGKKAAAKRIPVILGQQVGIAAITFSQYPGQYSFWGAGLPFERRRHSRGGERGRNG
ncbi:hypothetical protein B0H10DRAFT_1958763 [Mycena sp. CBHHK59/15]|nr:hypothetical protein B0H10DRAFT_1958763 [Mycena sp. CBHHK59/15]